MRPTAYLAVFAVAINALPTPSITDPLFDTIRGVGGGVGGGVGSVGGLIPGLPPMDGKKEEPLAGAAPSGTPPTGGSATDPSSAMKDPSGAMKDPSAESKDMPVPFPPVSCALDLGICASLCTIDCIGGKEPCTICLASCNERNGCKEPMADEKKDGKESPNQMPSSQMPSSQMPSNQGPSQQMPSTQGPQGPSNQGPSNQSPSRETPVRENPTKPEYPPSYPPGNRNPTSEDAPRTSTMSAYSYPRQSSYAKTQ